MATLKNTTIDDTGFLQIPRGTTGERPNSPELGMMRFNTDEEYIEFYNGVEWLQLGEGSGLYGFTSATFTPGGSTGTDGPSLTEARNGLSGPEVNDWKNDTEFFDTSSGIQLWTVPATGTYRFTIAAAKGGDAQPGSRNETGSAGRQITFDTNLTELDTLNILIGQEGTQATLDSSNGAAGGGGGGTFIYAGGQPLAVAGGGGGAGSGGNDYSASTSGTVGRSYTQTSGADGIQTSVSWNPAGNGGSNGGGGTKDGSSGAGGGGISGNGQGDDSYGGVGGRSFSNGGAGGDKREYSGTSSGPGAGGFGGGAGAGMHNNYECVGGGGGGYSGGGGGGTRVGGGGGGGSYLDPSRTTYVSETTNSGSGFVIIQLQQ